MRVIENMAQFHRSTHIKKAVCPKMSCLLLIPNDYDGN